MAGADHAGGVPLAPWLPGRGAVGLSSAHIAARPICGSHSRVRPYRMAAGPPGLRPHEQRAWSHRGPFPPARWSGACSGSSAWRRPALAGGNFSGSAGDQQVNIPMAPAPLRREEAAAVGCRSGW